MFIDMSDDIRVFTIYITVHNFFHIKFFQTFVQTLCSNQTSLCLYLRDKNDDINFWLQDWSFPVKKKKLVEVQFTHATITASVWSLSTC